jgi:ADP-heptose:LPS heptosyltransferase
MALGDSIQIIPTIKYLIRNNLLDKVYVVNPFYKELFSLFIEEDFIVVKKKGDTYKSNSRFVSPANFNFLCRHIIDSWSYMYLDRSLYIEDRQYPKPIKELSNPLKQKNYFVFGLCYSSFFKRLEKNIVEDIIDYCNDLGLEAVFLGKTNNTEHTFNLSKIEGYGNLKGINLINQTDLYTSLSIINDAKFMLGVDSGLVHLAGCTNVPIVVAYTHNHPEYLLPIRDKKLGKNCYVIEPDNNVCRYCLSNIDKENYGTYDIFQCKTGTNECVKSLKSQDFIDKIKLIMSNESKGDFYELSFN